MGYTTDFDGAFEVSPPLSPEQVAYLKKFAETRRVARKTYLTLNRPDPLREAVGLPVGESGGYFVGSEEMLEQEETEDILDYNSPPYGQPGLWCQWVPSEDGKFIVWDFGEKFYNYVEWIDYIIKHFLSPWGRKLNGEVYWQGEDSMDMGIIEIKDNVVKTKVGRVSYDYE